MHRAARGILSAIAAVALGTAAAPALDLVPVAEYRADAPAPRADIAFLPETGRFYLAAGGTALDVLALGEAGLERADSWDLADFGSAVAAVATGNGYIAVAMTGRVPTERGTLVLFDTAGGLIGTASLGVGPAAIAFSPDGHRAVVANAGDPDPDYAVDPEGSITLVAIPRLAVTEIGFAGLDAGGLDRSIHFASPPGTTLAQDFAPAAAAFSPDGATAYIALQENNALAIVDVATASLTAVRGLGYQDFSGIAVDVSDRDGGVHLTNWPARAMMQPGALATYLWRGETLLVAANQGMFRDLPGYSELARAADLKLDPVLYADHERLQRDENMGRLLVSTARGDADGDGDVDTVFAFGGRSFSILDATGARLYDPGSRIERQLAGGHRDIFNSAGTPETFDSLSPGRGVEPGGLALARLFTRTYALIGLHGTGGIAAFDVTSPRAVRWVGYYDVNRDDGDIAMPAPHLGPADLLFVPASVSPTGKDLLAAAYDLSGSVVLYRVE